MAQIDKLGDIYVQTKSIFPALDKEIIGKTSFATAPSYRWRGYNVPIIRSMQKLRKKKAEGA